MRIQKRFLAEPRLRFQSMRAPQVKFPPIDLSKPEHARTDLKIGCIATAQLEAMLQYEARIYPIPEKGWSDFLTEIAPDIILLESCFARQNGEWAHAMGQIGAQGENLRSLLNFARKRQIPTVYWMTATNGLEAYFAPVAALCDLSYACDAVSLAAIKRHRSDAQLLLAAVQPSMHNPFKLQWLRSALDIDILFTGWGPGLDAGLLEEVFSNCGFDIYAIQSPREADVPQLPGWLSKYWRGLSDNLQMLTLMRYAKTSLDPSPFMQDACLDWTNFALSASGSLVFHLGIIEKGDHRRGVIQAEKDVLSLTQSLQAHIADNDLRARASLLARRQLYSQHTIAHRLHRICQNTGLLFDWDEFPLVSVVTPSFRPHLIPKVIEQFKDQAYPNKELFIILNSDEPMPEEAVGLVARYSNVHLFGLPRERTIGESLNIGIAQASGKYCFKMDDDDLYGEHYLLDLIQAAEAVNADLFGRPPTYVYQNNDDIIYVRKKEPNENVIMNREGIENRLWIGGNTLSGKTKLFKRILFSKDIVGASDTEFQCQFEPSAYKVCLMDRFNMAAVRETDLSLHTWRANFEIQSTLGPLAEKRHLVFF